MQIWFCFGIVVTAMSLCYVKWNRNIWYRNQILFNYPLTMYRTLCWYDSWLIWYNIKCIPQNIDNWGITGHLMNIRSYNPLPAVLWQPFLLTTDNRETAAYPSTYHPLLLPCQALSTGLSHHTRFHSLLPTPTCHNLLSYLSKISRAQGVRIGKAAPYWAHTWATWHNWKEILLVLLLSQSFRPQCQPH